MKVKEPQPQEFRAAATGPGAVHVFAFRRQRVADAQRAGNGGDGGGIRNAARQARRFALPDPDERSRRPDEPAGRGQVPRATAGRSRDSAGGRSRRSAGPHRHSRRRRRRQERGPHRRRVPGRRQYPRHQRRPAAVSGRHHAGQREHALQRPAQHPRATDAGGPC